MANILVTGGAGYIGSHTCIELLDAGHQVVVLDNLSNSSEESLNRVQELTGKSLTFIQGDIRDAHTLDQLFQQHAIDAVIHFAGLKAVGESQQIPLAYFDNNIAGSISLAKAMERAGKDRMDIVNLSLGGAFDSWPSYPTSKAADSLTRKGVIVVSGEGTTEDDVMMAALEAGAEEIEPHAEGFEVITEATDLTAARGALVDDIVNTVAITAIQAQSARAEGVSA